MKYRTTDTDRRQTKIQSVRQMIWKFMTAYIKQKGQIWVLVRQVRNKFANDCLLKGYTYHFHLFLVVVYSLQAS